MSTPYTFRLAAALGAAAALVGLGTARAQWPADPQARDGRTWLTCTYTAMLEKAVNASDVSLYPDTVDWLDRRIQRSFLAAAKSNVVRSLSYPDSWVDLSRSLPPDYDSTNWPVFWNTTNILDYLALPTNFFDHTPRRNLTFDDDYGWPAFRRVLDCFHVRAVPVRLVASNRTSVATVATTGDWQYAWVDALVGAYTNYPNQEVLDGGGYAGSLQGWGMIEIMGEPSNWVIQATSHRTAGKIESDEYLFGTGAVYEVAMYLYADDPPFSADYPAWDDQGTGISAHEWNLIETIYASSQSFTSSVVVGGDVFGTSPSFPDMPGSPTAATWIKGFNSHLPLAVLVDFTAHPDGFVYRAD